MHKLFFFFLRDISYITGFTLVRFCKETLKNVVFKIRIEWDPYIVYNQSFLCDKTFYELLIFKTYLFLTIYNGK